MKAKKLFVKEYVHFYVTAKAQTKGNLKLLEKQKELIFNAEEGTNKTLEFKKKQQHNYYLVNLDCDDDNLVMNFI